MRHGFEGGCQQFESVRAHHLFDCTEVLSEKLLRQKPSDLSYAMAQSTTTRQLWFTSLER